MGTRADLTTDPVLQAQLLTARRGTALWLRALNELDDDEFDAPTILPDWDRRHLIAHVGYNARAISRLVHWANTGEQTPMYASPHARADEIAHGATLSTQALRTLNDHAASTLDNEWRDTPDPFWRNTVRTAQGRSVALRETVWMRTREVWLHAIDLNTGIRFADLPAEVLHRLLTDIVETWTTRDSDPGLRIKVDGTDLELGAGADTSSTLRVGGTLPAVVRWAAGRGGQHLSTGQHVQAPRWL
ncbi:maleylpyruvate isomerase family mycothiol-dependent enzyme [Jongsikchunia kroppenstedtii]|uniref:maleylpyruvate isomerase family mycothiol-dependent enzyme n=1 Tax=Jongsikchunia kroppenstedtii TaxID=1121721 RepID=UPI0003803CF9|nr:maleylpyruvate isomerase family mycothiol-dependent enzyme [Jongsikchunia kroppenstedtii]